MGQKCYKKNYGNRHILFICPTTLSKNIISARPGSSTDKRFVTSCQSLCTSIHKYLIPTFCIFPVASHGTTGNFSSGYTNPPPHHGECRSMAGRQAEPGAGHGNPVMQTARQSHQLNPTYRDTSQNIQTQLSQEVSEKTVDERHSSSGSRRTSENRREAPVFPAVSGSASCTQHINLGQSVGRATQHASQGHCTSRPQLSPHIQSAAASKTTTSSTERGTTNVFLLTNALPKT